MTVASSTMPQARFVPLCLISGQIQSGSVLVRHTEACTGRPCHSAQISSGLPAGSIHLPCMSEYADDMGHVARSLTWAPRHMIWATPPIPQAHWQDAVADDVQDWSNTGARHIATLLEREAILRHQGGARMQHAETETWPHVPSTLLICFCHAGVGEGKQLAHRHTL